MFLTGIAAVISVGMVRLILPRISSFPELNLALNWQENYCSPEGSGSGAAGRVVVGQLSSTLVLSSFKPARCSRAAVAFRQPFLPEGADHLSVCGGIVFLIIATMAAGGQLRYIQNKTWGSI